MLEFVISNYNIFIIIAIILLLGLIGYIVDRRKYEKYREELINEAKGESIMSKEIDIENVSPINEDNK